MSSVPTVHQYTDAPVAPAHYEMSDLGNAKRLVADHGQDLRHAPQIGRWLAWDGTRWAEDVTGEAQRRAKAVAETWLDEARRKADDKLFRHGIRAQSAAGINNMLSLAATEPGIPVLVDQLDPDPWLFNAANGTVDLRTGHLRPHDRCDLITKVSPAAYRSDALCPTWLRFLNDVFLGDANLIGFVRRFAGYSITGNVSEQVLMFGHGSGANGKSTCINTLRYVAGDYALQLDPAVLTASAHEQHPTGLMDLRGARLVSTIETEAGKRLNEALVKQLTGGDAIRARRMHRDYTEFLPSHKLLFAGNHLPRIDGTDYGIWRRLALVPFQARFDKGTADPHLPATLLAEADGILAWAVDGCLEWRRDGLRIPDAVRAATADYQATQDHVGRFLADTCLVAEHATVTVKALRTAYETWCNEQGERAWTARAVGRELTTRGFDTARVGNANTTTWLGLGLMEATL